MDIGSPRMVGLVGSANPALPSFGLQRIIT